MKQLSAETVRLLSSAQVITSVFSAVKELVENSLDAGADNIEVKLDNFGLEKIEVRDNGSGISPEDVLVMAQRHFTSKLSDIGDLASVTSYGFRGEALASLCAVSDVTVTTKRNIDNVSRVHTLNHCGEVTSSRPSHVGNGTTITATHLFKTVPVRRQYYNSGNRKKDELKKIEDLFLCYGCINPGVRFALSHNKKLVWQKNRVPSIRLALLNTVGSNVMNQMQEVDKEDEASRIKVSGFLPKLGSDLQLVGRHHSNDRCWIYVNKRPVQLKEVEKLIKEHYCKSLSDGTNVRHLTVCLNFELPTETVDINLEPDKCRVLLQNKDAVLELLNETLEELYRKNDSSNKTGVETNPVENNSQSLSDAQEQDRMGDEVGEVNKDDSTGNDLDGGEETTEVVRKFGASGDIRNQLREESMQTIEAFLFKELIFSNVTSDSEDQLSDDLNYRNEGVVPELEGKLKTCRSGLNDSREEPKLVNGTSLAEGERNLEREDDFPGQSRVESSQVYRKTLAAEETDTSMTQDNLSEKQKDDSYQPNGRIGLENREQTQTSEQPGKKSGDRNEGGGQGEENKLNCDLIDQATFTLFDDNIFLDSQTVGGETNGQKMSEEADHEHERAKGNQEIDEWKVGSEEASHALSAGTLQQISEGSDVLEEVGQSPEVSSTSSAESIKTDSIIAEGGAMAWSKGVLLGSKTTTIEPVKLLMPGISNLETDSASLKPGETHAKEHTDVGKVQGSTEENSSLPPLPTLPSNSTSNPPVNCTRDSLTLTEGMSKTLQHAGDSDSTPRRQDSGTVVPSADCDKLVSSSSSEDLVSSDGTGQRSGEMSTKSLPDGKGSLGENSSKSTSPKTYYDLVHGIPLRRPQNAYTHFLKEYGPKVGGCFPTIETESMDLLLRETWRELPEEKKKLYETMAEKDQERYDNHIADAGAAKRQKTLNGEIAIENPPTRKKKGKKVPLITNQGFIDGMLASQENRHAAAVTDSSDVIPTKEIPFSVSSLKDFMKESRQDMEEDSVSLVGRLPSHHVWITWNQSHLSVLHHLRAEEVVLFRRLMASHSLASTSLDVPIVLSESMLGCWSNWLTLLSMKSSPVSEDFVSIYTDERLVKNGFKVRRLIDLQEILKKVSKNAAVRLSQCRPLKVTNYLKSEAVRISRNRPSVLIQDDVVDLIKTLTKITHHPITCLHEKPVFHEFFSFLEET